MKAPRALPIVSGPVGLADTNSTLTEREPTGATRPHVVGRLEDPVDDPARASGRNRRFMNPGGATSTASIGESGVRVRGVADELRGEERRELQGRAPVRAARASSPGSSRDRHAPAWPGARPRPSGARRRRAGPARRRTRWRPSRRARSRHGPGCEAGAGSRVGPPAVRSGRAGCQSYRAARARTVPGPGVPRGAPTQRYPRPVGGAAGAVESVPIRQY